MQITFLFTIKEFCNNINFLQYTNCTQGLARQTNCIIISFMEAEHLRSQLRN